MTNKMTNRKALTAAITIMRNLGANPGTDTITIDKTAYGVKDVVEKLEGMIVALDNKATSTKRKPTAKQVENNGLREIILGYLTNQAEKPMTCTEIGKAISELEGMNNQRISALLRSLVESGQVEKATEKGKSVFSAATMIEDGE